MDVVRLGPPYNTAYQPDVLIEGYSSMVWTERQTTPGEFQMVTPKIAETLALLPEDTLISHLETNEVMIVEDNHIENDEDGVPTLTVTGRSLDCFTDHRFIEAPYQVKRKMNRNYSSSGASCVLLVQAFNNDTGKDLTRIGDYSWSKLDQIPNVVVTDSTIVGTARRIWLEQGQLTPQLQEILTTENLGIRVIRPSAASAGNIVYVSPDLGTRGTPTRVYTTNIRALRFDVYSGVDRSAEQSAHPVVGFSLLQGHIDKPSYLWSKKDMKTEVEVMGAVEISDVYRNTTEQGYSGLKRRVLAYDAGTPEFPMPPEKPDDLRSGATTAQRKAHNKAIDDWLDAKAKWTKNYSDDMADFKVDMKDAALKQLYDTRRVSMFTGDISPLAPYLYKTHYDLGDRVSLYGDYGEVETMVVSEYVRTEDAEGDRGMPGLTAP